MKEDREKWITDVFNSLAKSKRAKPSEDLFGRLEQQLFTPPDAKILPISQWRIAAAATVLLLFLNVFALQQSTQSPTSDGFGETSPVAALISNYKLYD